MMVNNNELFDFDKFSKQHLFYLVPECIGWIERNLNMLSCDYTRFLEGADWICDEKFADYCAKRSRFFALKVVHDGQFSASLNK